jgi:hypothetical protein
MVRSLKAILIGLGIIVLFFVSTIAPHALAASPQFLITWKTTGSYIPPNYQGKALPTYGSEITASLVLVSNGKVVDLSGQTIYWYLNSTLLGGGVGAQSITFPPLGEPPNTMTLEIDIPDYSSGYLIHTINIPMVQSETVIDAPYPAGQFSSNPVTVTAIPYFFNIASPSNLSYAWSVNGQSGSNTENPNMAQITLPQGTAAGTSFDVSLTVENPNDSTQATASQNLTYQPTP